jgi:hypothetical protein
VERLRSAIDVTDRQRAALMDAYGQQVAEGRSTAHLALEAVEDLDRERAEQTQRLADAEAILAEHDTDQDAVLTEALVESFRSRLTDADRAPALIAALAASLAGLWASLDDGRLRAEFELADMRDDATLGDMIGRAWHLTEHGNRVGDRVEFPVEQSTSPSSRTTRAARGARQPAATAPARPGTTRKSSTLETKPGGSGAA